MSPKKRRRNLALPFIVTIAASCSVQATTSTKSTGPNGSRSHTKPRPASIDHRGGEAKPLPQRQLEPLQTEDDPPTVLVNPPAPRPAVGDPGIGKANTAVRPQGQATGAHGTRGASTADPGIGKANTAVRPQGPSKLADAPKNGRVTKRADGTCWYSPKVDCSVKGRTCNPPPPRRVKCN